MFSHRQKEDYLPGWLWFFLILPLGLFVFILYRQNRLGPLGERIRSRLNSLRQPLYHTPRYTEPDSIPLEIRTGEFVNTGVETGPVTEDIPQATGQPEFAEPDDLKMIEGIGPSISNILRDNGIITFRQLANTPVERLEEILTKANLLHLADPATWPEQANLAAEGNWDGLKQFQDTLKGKRKSKST